MKWRIYHRPRGEHPSEFLGLVPGDTKADALRTAYAAWPGRTFDCISEASWQSMGEDARSFFIGTYKHPDEYGFRQVSVDMRACQCQGCGRDVFYRRSRNGNWRQPPKHCPACDPKNATRNEQSAYTNEP